MDGISRRMTEGEWRVGVNFNPSAHPGVESIKRRVAELIDDMNNIATDREHPGARAAALAMTEFESAAMWAVKAVTKTAR